MKENRPQRADKRGRPGLLERFLSLPHFMAVVIFAVALLLYSNTFENEFLWDDVELIVENPRIPTLNVQTLKDIFTKNFWEENVRIGGYYRPLVSLSYHVDYRLYKLNPNGFHRTNAFLNALTCGLVLLLVYALFGNGLLAFTTALFFATLPLHTENVAWVAGRTDVLATLWVAASLACYVLWKQRRNAVFLSLSLFAFVLALFSKEIAVGLPLIVLLLEFGPFERLHPPAPESVRPDSRKGNAKARRYGSSALILLYFGIVALYLLLRRNIIGSSLSVFEPYTAGVANTAALAFSILAGYCFKLIYPFRPNAEYDAPVPETLSHPHAVAGFILILCILFAAYRFRRKGEVLLGIGILLVGLAPVMNLVPIGEISAERFLYFPSLGFSLLLGVLFAELSVKRLAVLRILLLALVVAYGVQTRARNLDWRNAEVLFSKTVAAAPQSARAHLNLGNVHRERGRSREAIAEYERALEINPDYPDALSNLAGVYMERGEIEKVVPLLEKALQFAPNNPELQNNLGTILFQKQRYAEAEQAFMKALKQNPRHLSARFNLGLIKFKKKEYASARRLLGSVRDLGPAFILAYYYLALIEMNSGNEGEALDNIERFLSRYPVEDRYKAHAEEILEKLGGVMKRR